MKLKILSTIVASAALSTVALTSGASAATCHDAYAAWKQEALKDGKLLSTIHTGKRAQIFRSGIDKMRRNWATIKGNDPACRKFMAWLAAETATANKMAKGKKRIYADTDETSTVQASGLLDTTDRAMFMNRPMYDKAGVYVGTVDDVVMVEGKARYIAVSRDNFAGGESDVYVVPLNVLRVTSSKNAFVIGTDRDTFYSKYPHYKYGQWSDIKVKAESDAAFQTQTDDYYKSISAFGQ